MHATRAEGPSRGTSSAPDGGSEAAKPQARGNHTGFDELGLRPGMPATAVVKATSVMVEHS